MTPAHYIVENPAVKEARTLRPVQACRQFQGNGIAVLVINYNTAAQTLRCLNSIRHSTVLPEWVFVLDNASSQDDYQQLLQGMERPDAGVLSLYRSEKNLGFAQGSNVLIDLLLERPECQFIMLLNNDAVAHQEMLASLSSALRNAGEKAGLAGGRMHKLADASQVDTLGIALYASLMPADRKTTHDIYVGPTGGCCMFTRELVERLKHVSGYCFDSRFFCYCEDTDLVLRAVLLGYQPIYLDQVMACHEGQASSGGGYNPFIAYHGLRNALWMQVKLMPASLFLRYGVFLLAAHVLMIIRYTISGRFLLMLRVYRDALYRFPEFFAERRKFQDQCRGQRIDPSRYITRSFYRRGYFRSILLNFPILKNLFVKLKI